MKTLILSLLLLSSSYASAGTILECQSIETEAIYQLNIENGDRKVVLSPIVADDSALSSGVANLFYIEGESSPTRRSFGGENANGNKIALDLYKGSASFISLSEVVVAKIFFTEEDANRMTNKITLSCSLRLK